MKPKMGWVGLLVLGIFFLTRLYNLNGLPVFADEAIYIRWAQLMRQDFLRYALFPLQDGKTPLHMMLLSLCLGIYKPDALLVSRLLSVCFGLANLGLLIYLVKILRGGKLAQLAAALLYLVLPLSLFHDRMGLIDTMLLTFLMMSTIGFLQLIYSRKNYWIVVTGIAYGLALWTKLPALLFIPVYIGLFILVSIKNPSTWKQLLVKFGTAGVLGVLMFLLLRASPVFPALFSRGEDFTFTVTEVLEGHVDQIIPNIEKVSRWLLNYLTLAGILFVAVFVLVLARDKKGSRLKETSFGLLLLSLVFLLPFIIFGKVLAARYLLPVLIFYIPLISLGFEYFWQLGKKWLVVTVLILIGCQAAYFDGLLLINPAMTPFSREDVGQYLSEWSAGYGNKQVRDFILQESRDKKVVVATEGYFGTLPDGLLMYFDGSRQIADEHLEIMGIGQPVRELPQTLKLKAGESDTYLVVNEHRLLMDISDCCRVVAKYPRPRGGPALLLLKILANE